MDLGDKEEFGMEKMSTDHQSYTSMSTEWRLGDLRMGLVAPGPSVCQGDQMGSSSECTPAASMADTFDGRRHWGVHPTNSQSLAFCDGAIQSGASQAVVVSPRNPIAPPPRRLDMGWNVQESGMPRGAVFLQNGAGVIPPTLPSQFPTDSAFVERAARFSCFGGVGFGGAVSPFGSGDHMSPYGNSAQKGSAGAHASQNASISSDAAFNRGNGVGIAGNDSGDPEFSGGGREETLSSDNTAGGEPSSKGLVAKKRKGGNQEMDQDQSKGVSQLPVETKDNAPGNQKGGRRTSTSPSAKAGGKNGKDNASDASKEDYIHVRARRGQATNSHSLAERLRREKISERMKFLQDLVPGCSKVTGKAVMLDEIINYVQSLQRQVEFLSMKLAAVNPPLDVNIEGLLSKEILQSRANALPFGLTPEIGHHQMHSSQRAFVQSAIPGMRNPSDSHRRPMNIHLAALNGGYKEPSNQISTPWDDELHNVVHMDFGSSAALSIQDIQGSCPPPLMKMEP